MLIWDKKDLLGLKDKRVLFWDKKIGFQSLYESIILNTILITNEYRELIIIYLDQNIHLQWESTQQATKVKMVHRHPILYNSNNQV